MSRSDVQETKTLNLEMNDANWGFGSNTEYHAPQRTVHVQPKGTTYLPSAKYTSIKQSR